MSAPSSVKMSPTIPVDPRIRRLQLPYYLIRVWISLIPVVFIMYTFLGPVYRAIYYPTLAFTMDNSSNLGSVNFNSI